MGLRLQYALVGIIVFIVVLSFMVKGNLSEIKEITNKKDLEFTNTTLIEVDDVKLLGYTFATYGVRDDNILTLQNLIYKDFNIQKITALKGVYDTKTMTLEGDVDLYYKNDIRTKTQNAIYYRDLAKIEITTPFVTTTRQHIFKGKSFEYDLDGGIAKATKIDAILDTNKTK